ncbi:MAG TPA: cobalamin-binding protein [Methylomirabilota bacterium]|nr:cobalamin-binding protein [Methylomirabilota bacterium]
MTRRLALLAVLIVPLTAGPAETLSVRDMLGRDVTLPRPAARIVSLVPSVTEIVFALGAEERLVGRTDFCDHPPAVRAKPSVGGMVNPNLETLVALKPDLVIATDEGNLEETVRQLRRLRIPTYLVHANRIAETVDLIARVGELTGRQAAVAKLTGEMLRRVAAVRRAVAPFPRPRVLYVLWPEPLIVPGRSSILTELIEVAGGTSITAGDGDAYPRFSLEAAVARAPEVIILADHSTGSSTAGRPMPEQWQRLASVPAIRAGRLHSADLSVLHRYGPRVPDGLETLARIIHPAAFR